MRPPMTRCGATFLLVSTVLLLLSSFAPPLLLGNVEGQSTREVKGKVFYLHTLNETVSVAGVATQTIMNTTVGTSGQDISSVMRIIARWLLYPELAGDLHLNGTLTMTVWWSSSAAAGSSAAWVLTIREVFPDGSSVDIASSGEVTNSAGTAFEEDSVSLSIDHIFGKGSSIEAHFNSRGDSATTYTVAWGNATRDSRVTLPAQSYIRIVPQGEGGILTLDSQRKATTNFDPDAENKTVYFQVTVTNPFGGYDIRWTNLSVQAPNGTVIPGLDNVSMPKIEGFFNSFEWVYEVTWNYSGYPEGQYNVTVHALDNNGYLAFQDTGDFGGHLETETGIFFIGAPPIEVHIKTVDADNVSLAGAAALILLGDELQTSGTTNATGGLVINLVPGIYTLEVWWKDTLVGSFSLDARQDIPFDTPFVATAAVYDLVFAVQDSRGVGLSQAALIVSYPNGTVSDPPLVLDTSGNVSLSDMPGGSYDLTALWSGKVVGEQSFDIQLSGTYLIATAVYYVDFTVLDADGIPVDNALITVSDPASGALVESRLTSTQGQLVSRVPLGSYRVSASWFGIPVMADTGLDVAGDTQMTLNLTIFSTAFRPVDSRGIPLQDATVQVTAGGFTQIANTLGEGSVTFRTPSGSYRIVVTWQGVEVFDEVQSVDGTSPTLDLAAQVAYLALTVKDANGAPLEGAFVTVMREAETVAATSTDAEGRADIRLPHGTYEVSVSYRSTYLMTDFATEVQDSAELTQDLPLEVTMVAFPPPVYTTVLFYLLIAVAAIGAGLAYALLKIKGVI